jgi:hypothetical protein
MLALAMAGCGSSGSKSTTAPAGLQAPAPAALFNSYIGTSPNDSTASEVNSTYKGGGLWTASLNHNDYTLPPCSPSKPCFLFNALDVTTSANNSDSNIENLTGVFVSSGGFLSLTETNDPDPSYLNAPAGFALEIPGRAVVLRQGDFTTPLTAMVSDGCPSIHGNTKFNFVTLPTDTSALNTSNPWDPVNDAAYGAISISNSGATWNFATFQQSTLDGVATALSGTALPSGTCAPTAAGTAVFLPWDPKTILSPLPKNLAVGPSGFYIADQGQDINGIGYPGEFGVIQPSAPLATTDVLSHQYIGFIFEPGADGVGAISESQMTSVSPSVPAGQLVATGLLDCAAGPCNPLQPAATDLAIDLGTQDAKNNGVYPNVSITNLTTGSLPYQGVAVVGKPEGKYAILIIGYDTDYALPLGIYLFQQ